VFVPAPVADRSALETTSGGNPDVTPFSLEVLDEANDGERLAVHGRVVPKVAWDPSQVVVRLSALDENGESRLSYYSLGGNNTLQPGAGAALEPGRPAEFTLAIPSAGITNYQLELLWGADARPFLKEATAAGSKGKEFLALRNLEVHRVPGEECSNPDACRVKFTITGEFYNSGSGVVTRISLKAGFVPADQLDLPDQIFENERRIEIRNLRLGPGSTKPFRLALEKEIPSTQQIAPKPMVRILSFDSE
jgi:hypothetical protein